MIDRFSAIKSSIRNKSLFAKSSQRVTDGINDDKKKVEVNEIKTNDQNDQNAVEDEHVDMKLRPSYQTSKNLNGSKKSKSSGFKKLSYLFKNPNDSSFSGISEFDSNKSSSNSDMDSKKGNEREEIIDTKAKKDLDEDEESEDFTAFHLLQDIHKYSLKELQSKILTLKDYGKNIKHVLWHSTRVPIESFNLAPEISNCINNNRNYDDIVCLSSLSKTPTRPIQVMKKKEDKKSNEEPKSLKKLRISSIITLFSLILFSIIDFYLNVDALNKVQINIDMINNSYEALNEVAYSQTLIRNILLANEINYSNFIGYTDRDLYQQNNMKLLTGSNTRFQKIISNIELSVLDISTDHRNLLFNKVVNFYDLSDNTIKTHQLSLLDSMSLVSYI